MLKSYALMFMLALLWGGGFPLIKIAVETLPPLTVAAARTLIGGLLLLAVLGPRANLLWRSGIPLRLHFRQALFNCVLPWSMVSWATQYLDASLATILNSLSPIFIFVITWSITRHEVASPRKLAGVLLGLGGVAVIVGPGALRGFGVHTLAELACIAGSLCYAIAGIIGRRYDGLTPLVPAAAATLAGGVMLIPVALAVEQPWTLQPSMRSVVAVLSLGIFSTGFAFFIYFRLLATIGSIATASQAYLRILFGAALGVVFLGERLSATQVAGLGFVVAGVVAMTLPGPMQAPRR